MVAFRIGSFRQQIKTDLMRVFRELHPGVLRVLSENYPLRSGAPPSPMRRDMRRDQVVPAQPRGKNARKGLKRDLKLIKKVQKSRKNAP
jgi:hypothetical protein